MIDLQIKTETLGDEFRLISVVGEVDLYTAPQLKTELNAAADESTRAVIVDLTECTFIDSTALGVLVSAKKSFVAKGLELSLAISDHNILKVFEITGLNRVFRIHVTRSEAVDGL
ncbi:MAG TPA: STAS domain-containing protein [Gaiellaceae bacterium]|nr:STAS domain-containing protein [Gaiellaceae bacterium]